MTEKEKSHKGLLYYPLEPALTAERRRAKEVCFAYNRLSPAETNGGEALMRGFLGKTGRAFVIEKPFICDYGYNVEIGENFFSNYNFVVLDEARVTIGDNVFIAPNVGIYTATHPINAAERNQGLEYARPVAIGDNVWIGAGAQILPGVTIGSNAVIGAGSVVNKDVPANVMAAGNPCRVIKKI